jgi:hypothetical protein
MNVFILLKSLKIPLASLGFGICLLPVWLGLLYLVFGLAGVLWFMGTGILVVFLGTVVGLIALPGLENSG